MSAITDVVGRVAKRFEISNLEALALTESVISDKIAAEARVYIGKVELNEEPVARLLAFQKELRSLTPPELPKAQAPAKK